MAKKFVGQEYSVATRGKGLVADPWYVRLATKLTITVSVLVMLVSVAMIAFCTMFMLSPVVGTSMMTTLNATGANTDSALASKVKKPTRGDIVVAKLYFQDTRTDVIERYENQDQHGNFMYIIKRLIAQGGDQLTVKCQAKVAHPQTDLDFDYFIYLKEKGSDTWHKLNEPYLDPGVAHLSSLNYRQLYYVLHDPTHYYCDVTNWVAYPLDQVVQDGVLTVPDDAVFLMGDNRGGQQEIYGYSWDSCYLGPHRAADVIGVCVDIMLQRASMLEYLWQKVTYYLGFGWLRG